MTSNRDNPGARRLLPRLRGRGGMQRVRCTVNISSSAEHLSQLYTGFALLARRGLIEATLRRASDYSGSPVAAAKLLVMVNDRCRVVYDTTDRAEVFEKDLDWCDLYFKRSFDPAWVCQLEQGAKVYPLGLNYSVHGPGDHAIRRALWSLSRCRPSEVKAPLLQLARSSTLLSRLFRIANGRYTLENFEGMPDASRPPRILLLTRTHDPDCVGERQELIAEREYINYMRAECIRGLKREFGSGFFGGFAPTAHARNHFPDCVVDEPSITRKENYLDLVRETPICVSTMGLRQSNGWRLAEYVAGAKAILSERLHHRVPGGFAAGKNYLEFTTADECVTAASDLVEQPSLRYEIMQSNHGYYHTHVRPDSLVWNTIQKVLGHGCPSSVLPDEFD